MKKNLLLATLLFVATITNAVPAKKVWRTFNQPDGTTIELMLVGDENLHYYITRDNVPVVCEDDERYCYAKQAGFSIMSTGVIAHEAPSRSVEEKAHMTQIENIESVRKINKVKGVSRSKRVGEPDHPQFLGKKKGLIILANFSDKKFYDYSDANQGYDTWARYDAMANEEGFTNDYGAIGSVHDYYHDMSYGKFNLTFDVVGPVNLDKPVSYYGKNTGQDDLNAPEMIVECCQAVDDEVDFNDYDWDGDGVVEEVFVLYAGYGEATGGASSTIWPHMWQLDAASLYNSQVPEELILDCAFINVYACSNELYGNSGKTEMGMGVLCHEFSHCLGLPDMYDTSYHGNFGMGEWDILDGGSYNGPMGIGWVPAGYTSYERCYAGWLKYTELKKNRRILNQKPITSRGNAYVIYNDSCQTEYYLLENRAQESWDAYIPGEGLLIMHVDYDPDLWAQNMVNTTGSSNDHQRLTVFHASNSTRGGHEAYPYNGNDSLTDNSSPAAKLYNPNTDGSYFMHKPITEITRNEETGYISFLFRNENDGTVDIGETMLTDDQRVEIYTLEGMRLLSNVKAESVYGLNPGTYILRSANGLSRKIVVK